MSGRSTEGESVSSYIAACERQCDVYDQLLACFDAKERAIREARPESMQAISEREVVLLRDLRALETQRKQKLQSLLPAGPTRRTDEPSTHDLLEHLNAEQRERVQPIVARMRHAADRVRQRSAVLRCAAESLSAHLSGIVRSAWGMMEQNTVYERSGRVATAGANLGIDVKS